MSMLVSVPMQTLRSTTSILPLVRVYGIIRVMSTTGRWSYERNESVLVDVLL